MPSPTKSSSNRNNEKDGKRVSSPQNKVLLPKNTNNSLSSDALKIQKKKREQPVKPKKPCTASRTRNTSVPQAESRSRVCELGTPNGSNIYEAQKSQLSIASKAEKSHVSSIFDSQISSSEKSRLSGAEKCEWVSVNRSEKPGGFTSLFRTHPRSLLRQNTHPLCYDTDVSTNQTSRSSSTSTHQFPHDNMTPNAHSITGAKRKRSLVSAYMQNNGSAGNLSYNSPSKVASKPDQKGDNWQSLEKKHCGTTSTGEQSNVRDIDTFCILRKRSGLKSRKEIKSWPKILSEETDVKQVALASALSSRWRAIAPAPKNSKVTDDLKQKCDIQSDLEIEPDLKRRRHSVDIVNPISLPTACPQSSGFSPPLCSNTEKANLPFTPSKRCYNEDNRQIDRLINKGRSECIRPTRAPVQSSSAIKVKARKTESVASKHSGHSKLSSPPARGNLISHLKLSPLPAGSNHSSHLKVSLSPTVSNHSSHLRLSPPLAESKHSIHLNVSSYQAGGKHSSHPNLSSPRQTLSEREILPLGDYMRNVKQRSRKSTPHKIIQDFVPDSCEFEGGVISGENNPSHCMEVEKAMILNSNGHTNKSNLAPQVENITSNFVNAEQEKSCGTTSTDIIKDKVPLKRNPSPINKSRTRMFKSLLTGDLKEIPISKKTPWPTQPAKSNLATLRNVAKTNPCPIGFCRRKKSRTIGNSHSLLKQVLTNETVIPDGITDPNKVALIDSSKGHNKVKLLDSSTLVVMHQGSSDENKPDFMEVIKCHSAKRVRPSSKNSIPRNSENNKSRQNKSSKKAKFKAKKNNKNINGGDRASMVVDNVVGKWGRRSYRHAPHRKSLLHDKHRAPGREKYKSTKLEKICTSLWRSKMDVEPEITHGLDLSIKTCDKKQIGSCKSIVSPEITCAHDSEGPLDLSMKTVKSSPKLQKVMDKPSSSNSMKPTGASSSVYSSLLTGKMYVRCDKPSRSKSDYNILRVADR